MPPKQSTLTQEEFEKAFSDWSVSSTVEVAASTGWVLPNRVKFPSFIQNTFRYPLNKRAPRGLFPYQRFIKDYIQPASPYRGILLMHGLGLGKTCTSIVAAENLMQEQRVVVMLPASLRANYIEQIKTKCGNTFFSTRQQWRFVSTKEYPGTIQAFAQRVSVPEAYLRKKKGAWIPVTVGGISFTDLSEADKRAVDAQLDQVIQEKYIFVNYNGLRSTIVADFEKQGMFDDKVVIIDEVHNFISRTLGSTGRDGAESIGRRMYRLLITAKNCRIIALSGTPIINHPYEVAYLINLLAGVQRRYTLKDVSVDSKQVAAHLDDNKYVDYYTYDAAKKEVVLKLVPTSFAFVNKSEGLSVIKELEAWKEADVVAKLKGALKAKSSASADTFLLPFDKEAFSTRFLDFENATVNNPRQLAKRMMGFVSYFGTYYGDLYPTVLPTERVVVEMTDTQFKAYEESRLLEIKMERRAKRDAAKAVGNGDPFQKVSQVYRAYSRALCNFVFPPSIKRPFPSSMSAMEKELDTSEPEAGVTTETRAAKATEYATKVAEAMNKLQQGGNNFLVGATLRDLSPKFAKITDKVKKAPGKALVYSQFRAVEGLGVLSLALEANGWQELKLRKLASGEWDVAGSPSALDAPRFFQYRNTEESKILLQIFNNNFEGISQSLRRKLGGDGADNLRGAMLKLAMITQSGAEGISLKHVRQVHIVEPYWNEIRINQVIGRAVRAASHVDLPPEERNVRVYRYLTKLSAKQAKESKTLQNKDEGRTTDEHIDAIAQRKDKIIKSIEEVMKSAAVDCVIHNKYHQGVRCLAFPEEEANPMALSYDLDLDRDENNAQYKQRVRSEKRVEEGYRDCAIDNVHYAYKNKELYDLEAYKQGKLVKLGTLKREGNAWRVV